MATEREIEAELSKLVGVSAITHVITAGQKYVFRATVDGDEVALKAILIGFNPKDPGNSEDLERLDELRSNAARLQREIEILRRCTCDSIVGLARPDYLELPVAEELFGVYGEQWIEGLDLRALFRQRPLQRAEAIRLGIAMCDAVAELDRHGYVHRDIKPQNVMLRHDGAFLLVDPGMALDRSGVSLTTAGNVPGTAAYISPEQWDPHRKRDLDARSDMFALGIVLFEGLAGQHPFYQSGMSHIDIMTAARSTKRAVIGPNILPDDDALKVIIMRLLAQSPHGRYRDTETLRKAFEAAQ